MGDNNAVTDRESATESARETGNTGRERVQKSEKERFKSLVKLWDSSRSPYATVGLTHRQQHTHVQVQALLNMRHKDHTEANIKGSDTMHTSHVDAAAKEQNHMEVCRTEY